MTNMCVVCEVREITQNKLGRGGAITCSVDCSSIRNSVKTDELAREKYKRLNQNRRAYRIFVLGFTRDAA